MSNILRYPLARAGAAEAAGRKRERKSRGQEHRARPSPACRRAFRETWSPSVCNVCHRPSLGSSLPGTEETPVTDPFALPSWDLNRIYQQFGQRYVSSVPQHTRTQAQVFLSTFPNQSSASLLDWNLLTALSDGGVCSESKKLFPKKSILSFNFNYVPVQITGN